MPIELLARLYCDRCHKTILEMIDVQDMAEAEHRLSENGWSEHGCEDEDGNDVCAARWREYDAKQHLGQPQAVGAVDPSAASTGTPTPRDGTS